MHPDWQQVPPRQKFEVHSSFSKQGSPGLFLAVQVPAGPGLSQKSLGDAQSVSKEHEVRQVFPGISQTRPFGQVCGLLTQFPEPLHVAAGI